LSIWISSVSPGMAPAMAIGPVTMWPAVEPGLALMMADSSGGMVNGALAGGITDSRPETH
jgi:hypothetical protein